MNLVFLMDPLETVNISKDTSFLLMLGAHKRGHKIFFLPRRALSLKEGILFFRVLPVTPRRQEDNPFDPEPEILLHQDQVEAVFVRLDPPFNEDYLRQTWLLDHLPPSVCVINSPLGLRTVNEKIWVTQFVSLVPKTLITSHVTDCLSFLEEEKKLFGKEGKIILKPTDAFGGQGIFLLKEGDPNLEVTFETLSQNGEKEIIVQRFVPEARLGDKRILLLNGEPLGAVLRLHPQGGHRNNFFSGGEAKPTEITKNDHKIIKTLQPALRKLGLFFVGIDLLGEHLIEVNVTSPTCLQEMNRIYEKSLEESVILFLEERMKAPPKSKHSLSSPGCE